MAFPVMAAALGLAEFAPIISRWLGGSQARDIAQRVVDIAKQVTGSIDDLDSFKSLANDPNLLAEFQKAILKIEVELEGAYLQDRQSARQRDVALAAAGKTNNRADVMVVAAAAGLVTCLASLVYYNQHLPGEAVGIISTVAGIFGACLKDAYAFEFGSSRGSKDKDSTVALMIERKTFG
jgi:hypothetical protein